VKAASIDLIFSFSIPFGWFCEIKAAPPQCRLPPLLLHFKLRARFPAHGNMTPSF
jgi:hypothetical protein